MKAQKSLALVYYCGLGVPKDFAKAAHWYRKAAEQGDADAQRTLGMMYEQGVGVRHDAAEAAKWYRRAVDGYRKAAEQGEADAQDWLGDCYQYGQGVTQDYAVAAEWYYKAAEQGDQRGEYDLGLCYESGQGVPQDYGEAIKWLQKAADKKDPLARVGLLDCYVKLAARYVGGKGVRQDWAESAKWYRKAAEQGDAGAQEELGFYYANGLGVRQDIAEAREWSLKAVSQYLGAAEQGDADAQCQLGQCYDSARDYGEAAKWYRRSAEQGNTYAQNNLGCYYRSGQGVPENDIEAYKWFSLAAAQGGMDVSAKSRDQVAERMSRYEIVEGQRRASAFVAREESTGNSPTMPAQPRSVRTRPKASGTAFFVTEDGYLLSNFHVIEGASQIRVKTSHGLLTASVVKTDTVNDVALLKVPESASDFLESRSSFKALPLASSGEVEQGQSVFTVGFPNIELQGMEPKLTKGEINSLSGAQDDPRQFQISAAVQPGNSGGPLLDTFGNVVGIVTARLSDYAALQTSGALPENVNYATKISYAVPLVQSVPGLLGKLKAAHPAKQRKFEEAVQEARDATVLVLVY